MENAHGRRQPEALLAARLGQGPGKIALRTWISTARLDYTDSAGNGKAEPRSLAFGFRIHLFSKGCAIQPQNLRGSHLVAARDSQGFSDEHGFDLAYDFVENR